MCSRGQGRPRGLRLWFLQNCFIQMSDNKLGKTKLKSLKLGKIKKKDLDSVLCPKLGDVQKKGASFKFDVALCPKVGEDIKNNKRKVFTQIWTGFVP